MGAGDEVPEGDGLRGRENLAGGEKWRTFIAGVWKAKMAGIAWGMVMEYGITRRGKGRFALGLEFFLIAGWCCSLERRAEK